MTEVRKSSLTVGSGCVFGVGVVLEVPPPKKPQSEVDAVA